jgi:hypothetical protein
MSSLEQEQGVNSKFVWCKEHIPPNGSDPMSEEGQTLLDQPDLLKDKRILQWGLHWEYYTSLRKRQWPGTNEDDTFLLHNNREE